MKRITAEVLRSIVLATGQAELDGQPLDLRARTFALALQILKYFMGNRWVERNIVEKGDGPDPFRASAENPERFKIFSRVVTLAEMLLNFQDVEGFWVWCRDLRTRDEVEPRLAEIQGAAILYSAGFKFRFRNSAGHDLDIRLPNGDAAAEIKRKLEGTKLSVNTIYNVLEDAPIQLPDDRAAFVFLNIPDTWPSNPDVNMTITNAMEAFFRNAQNSTRKVTTIFIWWEEFVHLDTGGLLRTYMIREEKNPNSNFSAGPVTQLAMLTQNAKVPWKYLHQIIIDIDPLADDGSVQRPR